MQIFMKNVENVHHNTMSVQKIPELVHKIILHLPINVLIVHGLL